MIEGFSLNRYICSTLLKISDRHRNLIGTSIYNYKSDEIEQKKTTKFIDDSDVCLISF